MTKSNKLEYSFFTKEPNKRNPERIKELIELRSKELHKASSVRYRQTKDRFKDLTEPARTKRIEEHRGRAKEYFKLLLDELVNQFPDQRPAPAESFEYDGRVYRLQNYDGCNATYVEESLFNKECYHFNRDTYHSHLIRHFFPGGV